MRDIAYEYLAHHRWNDLGHHQRFAECVRFARFVRDRILKRRRPPEHIDDVLRFELAVIDLLRTAAETPPGQWPQPAPSGEAAPLAGVVPRRGPAVAVVDLPLDIVDWLADPAGPLAPAGPGPIHALVWVGGPTRGHSIERLAPSERDLLERVDGVRTVGRLLDETEAAHRDPALAALRRWMMEGVVAPCSSP
jgi:hypothetical protein